MGWCALDECGCALQYYIDRHAVEPAAATERQVEPPPKRKQKWSQKPQPKQALARKCRVLCLHGSMQSGAIFEKRLSMLLKKTKAVAEYTFVDAPHLLSADDAEGDKRCWWKAGAQRGVPHEDWATQWDDSKQVIELAMRQALDAGSSRETVLVNLIDGVPAQLWQALPSMGSSAFPTGLPWLRCCW